MFIQPDWWQLASSVSWQRPLHGGKQRTFSNPASDNVMRLWPISAAPCTFSLLVTCCGFTPHVVCLCISAMTKVTVCEWQQWRATCWALKGHFNLPNSEDSFLQILSVVLFTHVDYFGLGWPPFFKCNGTRFPLAPGAHMDKKINLTNSYSYWFRFLKP